MISTPSEKELSDAMAFMDRDRSGHVEFNEFLWWWREQTAGEDVVQATKNAHQVMNTVHLVM